MLAWILLLDPGLRPVSYTHLMSTTGTVSAQATEQKKHGSLAGRTFERLGMLPVLIVMYALFYGLTLYFSADGTSNFATAANNMNLSLIHI